MTRVVLAGALVLAALTPSACRRAPTPDAEAARAKEAHSYLQMVDLEALVESAADQYGLSWRAERRQKLLDFIRGEARWADLENSIAAALAKNFAAREIHALAEFQGSPEGKSILGKLPRYQAEVLPILLEEVQSVLAAFDFAASALRWDAVVRDITTGPADDIVTAEFSFRNSGTNPVGLVSITTSCGCTTAKPEKTLFHPGERGSIHVLFTRGNRTGLQDERIVVTTDEPEKPALTLRLRVKIEDPLKISARLLFWTSGSPSSAQTVILEVPAGAGLDILGLDFISEGFTAQKALAREASSVRAEIAPRSTLDPSFGKAVFQVAVGGGRVVRVPVFLRVLPLPSAGRTESGGGGDIIWIDAQPSADDERPRIPGAFPLSEDSWDAQIETILARWTPDARIVILSQPAGVAASFAERLKAYGLSRVYGLIPIQ